MLFTIATRIYLGGNINPTGTVSDADFQTFLDEIVTPRFPGFTVAGLARGQWLGNPEPVRILIVLNTGTDDETETLRFVAQEYKRWFSQESVIVTNTETKGYSV